MEGIVSGFTTIKPIWEEYQDQVSFPRLQLTSDEPWKPTSYHFSVEEQLVTDRSDLVDVLDNVCHLTLVQRITLVNES